MAYVVHPHVEFRPAAVNHSPSPLGFGFGLAASSAWQPQGLLSSCGQQQSLVSQHSSPHKSAQKRRHEDTDGDRDESMDRSPTPERRPMRRILPKRSRLLVEPVHEQGANNNNDDKENRTPNNASGDGVDVGMLLASLPPQSLLPILNSLLVTMPALKPTILSLIPRPTMQTAVAALNQAAKQLREAHPYSAPSAQPSTSTSFGFGGQQLASRSNLSVPSSSGFLRPSPSQNGMRDAYVISRLRPHVNDFVSTASSYMPYFSYLNDSSSKVQAAQGSKDKTTSHPTETFEFLSTLTSHLLSQPQLTQSLLLPQILPRLLQEWMAWVLRVDNYINKEAGMFGQDTAQGWIRALDQYADAKLHGVDGEMATGFQTIRNRWVSQVGWLVGRREVHSMEEEEEL
ncbi:hypothetical protein SCHPADRAFT_996611 [Schizopora paradoxa]|uniref:Tethering factor for nuclear proteasome STS1 n=1 Tax=Schizopora paradoxa TaxID=27342 RepID=A0A0H2SC57_9AGAM|nr:hypothetical protein SCHPADRAFT_996611 [Schizopora paradoxa]